MMGRDKLPIKFVASREVEEYRVERLGSSKLPNWLLKGDQLAKRASELLVDFEKVKHNIIDRKQHESVIPFLFVVKLCDGSIANSFREDILAFFRASGKFNVIGLANPDELLVMFDSISLIEEISNRLRDHEHNSYAISCLESISEFQPFIQVDESETTHKIKLIDFQDYELNSAMQRLFERTLATYNIEYKKTNYTRQLTVYKVKSVSRAMLDQLRDEDAFELVFSVEPMPKYFVK